jgi:formate dehydrogenase iron-sulfur subunit
MPLTMELRKSLARRVASASGDSARGIAPRAPAARTAREGMLFDMTRCIGCQACTVACKEWNDLPATMGEGRLEGPSLQSVADLGPDDWTLIRFSEIEWPSAPGGMLFRMRKDSCHHCGTTPCAEVCPVGAISVKENGTVLIDQQTCIGCGYCTSGCPFGVPRVDAKQQKAFKCTLCYDRTSSGMEPACAQACPTDAIVYGSLTELHAEAERRVAAYNARRPAGTPEAYVYDAPKLEGLGVFYILNAPVETYAGRHTLPTAPKMSLALSAWKHLLKPGGVLGIVGAVGLAAAHFMAVGPKAGPSAEKVPTPDENLDSEGAAHGRAESDHG